MKELTIEQKAQRYDEAIEIAKEINNEQRAQPFNVMTRVFPELKESEDERIRKEILDCFRAMKQQGCFPSKHKDQYDSWIAWLGKQGDQKPADETKPKFHEGEWLCENEPNNYARFIQILEIVNVQGKKGYRFSRDIHNDEDIVEFDFVEKYYHKFGIQDAKPGDVLSYRNGQWIFIYKDIVTKDTFKYYALLSERGVAINDTAYSLLLDGITPTTKEQRDTLFAKIKEAGFEWDAKKKELKKIEQNHAWSEEDENMLGELLDYCNLSIAYNGKGTLQANIWEQRKDWLKFLKPNHWKPSLAQLNALSIVAKGNAPGDVEEIKSLLNDLKKLTE